MLKRTAPFSLMAVLLTVFVAHAAQQPVTTITSGTGTSGLTIKKYNDDYINPRLTNIGLNDTDLYTNKADKTQVVRYWEDWPSASPGNVLAVGVIVAYEGDLYKTIQQFTKTAGATPDTFTAYFTKITGVAGGAVAIDDLTDVDTTGKATGKILKFDASGNLVVGDDDTGSGSVPTGSVNGQVLIWQTDAWVPSTAPYAAALGADDNYVTDAEKTKLTNLSGANSGDNAVNSNYSSLVTNATHTGDVTGSGALTIANGAVTLAKMADMATGSLIYRKTASAGTPEVNTLATLKTDLGLTGTNSGDQTLPTAASLSVDDLITLSGVATGAVNLGTFTGATIADSSTIKVGMQALETAVETKVNTSALGTAASLDHGTAIGNLIRLTDDGGGNAALPFSLYLTSALLGNSTSLPGTCTVGQVYYDLDADTDGELYVCRATNTWKAVDDDGGSTGTPTAITVADTTDTTSYVALFTDATGDLGPKTDTGLTYNASTGMLTATGFTGPLTGTASGNPVTVASGTVTFNPSSVSTGACSSAVTGTATGTATTDVIDWTFATTPVGVTGYNPSGDLGYIVVYPTTNTVNFAFCNKSGNAIDPGAIDINWKVRR